ncbi:hypothetical protein FQA39_LY15381 [Lamprigera yunnana]|nr:hypothetical protein FQA39_LY15381 [Lamprigera yunnana]
MWLLLLFAVCLSLIFYLKVAKKYHYWHDKGVPYIKPIYFFGNYASVVFRKKSIVEMVIDTYSKYPNSRYVGFYQPNHQPVLMLRDPDLIKDVTIKEFESFPDHKQFVPHNIDPLWDKNLLQMSTEDGWHTMRTTLSPSFTSSKLKMMFHLMQDCATQFVNYFKSQEGEVLIELKDTFTRFTNDIIATCAFGIQCDSLKDRNNDFYLMGKEATDFSGLKGLKFFGYEFSGPLMKLLKIKMFSDEVSAFFRKVVLETLNHRRQNNIVRPDMIHLLLEASKKVNNLNEEEKSKNIKNELSHDDITAQALIFFSAGFETVSSAMSYLCYELAVHPDIQERLYNEIKETLEGSPKLTYETITSMKYLESCVLETLRLHSSIPGTDRKCQKPYTINPVHPSEKPLRIEKGQLISIPICALHHDEQYFPNSYNFDPERFNAENKSKINPYVFIPFGIGPRNCIGSRFALVEIKLVMVNVLKAFEIVVNKKTAIPLNYSSTSFNLIPDNGIWVSFKPRVFK